MLFKINKFFYNRVKNRTTILMNSNRPSYWDKSLWMKSGGVGRRISKRLAEHNIHTVEELRHAHTPTLRAEFGVVIASQATRSAPHLWARNLLIPAVS